MIKLALPLFFLFTFLNTVNSQIFVKTNTTLLSTDTCNHYSQIVSGLNIPLFSSLSTMYDDINGNTIFEYWQNGDTIISDCQLFSVTCIFNGNVIAYSNAQAINNFQVISYQEPTTLYSSDGSISLLFETPQLGLVVRDEQLFNTYPYTTADSLLFHVQNVRHGGFNLYNFAPPMTSSENCMGFIGNPIWASNNSANLNVSYAVVDTDPNCTGSIQLTSTNSVGEVQYYWSNDNEFLGNFQQNLCPGMYSVYAVDDAQQTAMIQIPVLDSTNSYYDNSVNMYQAGDTVYYDFLNCELDYNLPIDSIDYTETFIALTSESVSYLFELTVYQNSNSFVFSDTLYVGSDSNIYMSISVFCQLFKTTDFKGKKIALIRHGDIAASVSKVTIGQQVAIYPNPTNDNITILGILSKGIIVDVQGRVVLEFNSPNVSLSNIENGVYYIKLDELTEMYKILKID